MGLFGEIIAERNERECERIFEKLLKAYRHHPVAVEALQKAREEVLDAIAD